MVSETLYIPAAAHVIPVGLLVPVAVPGTPAGNVHEYEEAPFTA